MKAGKKSWQRGFGALSLALLFSPEFLGALGSIDNSSKASKIVNADDEMLSNGYIKTTGTGHSTIVYFNGKFAIAGMTNNSKIQAESSGENMVSFEGDSLMYLGSVEASDSGQNILLDIRQAGNPFLDAGSSINTISATNSGSNHLFLLQASIQKITASKKGDNNITISEGDSQSRVSNIAAEDQGSKNKMEFYNTSIFGMTASNSGANELDLYGGSSTGVFKATSSGSNTIMMGNDRHKTFLDGSIQAESSGKNTITINNAEISQGIIANNKGANTITITSSAINDSRSDIIANAGGTNTVTFEADSVLSGNIIADGGTNTATFNSNAALVGNITASKKGTNTATLNAGSFVSGNITANAGTNTAALTSASVYGDITANANGINTVTLSSQSLVYGDIIANAAGKNNITFSGSNLTGNLIANANGVNTITSNGDKSTITGRAEANGVGAKNTMTLSSNFEIGERVLSQDGGQNSIIVNQTLFTPQINAFDDTAKPVATSVNNIIGMNAGGILESTYISAIGTTASNYINGKGTINLYYATSDKGTIDTKTPEEILGDAAAMRADEKEKTVILAQGAVATNKFVIGVNGKITGNVIALDGGTNGLLTNQITQDGKIIAQNGGSNSIVYGSMHAKPVVMTNSHMIARVGRNHTELSNTQFNGSMQALLAGSANEVKFNMFHNRKLGSFRAYFVAIDDKAKDLGLDDIKDSGATEAINEIDIRGTNITLIGTQVYDAAYNQRGTGKDAIYTEGKGAKNIIRYSDTDGEWNITGNITAFNEGKNVYGFTQKVTMKGALHAENSKNVQGPTSNAVALNKQDSIISGGYMLAKGDNTANTLYLKANSTLKSSYLAAKSSTGGSAVNTIEASDTSSVHLTASPEDFAVLAQKSGAKNTISGTTTSDNTISGTISASDSAINSITLPSLAAKSTILADRDASNTITSSIKLYIYGGYISATGLNSSNTISSKLLTLDLIANPETTHAIYAENRDTNTLTTEDFATAKGSKGSTITGNIASDSGQNSLKIGKLVMKGSVIALDGGLNTIDIGKPVANVNVDPSAVFKATPIPADDGGSFTGGVYALQSGSENSIYFNAPNLLQLQVDPIYGGKPADKPANPADKPADPANPAPADPAPNLTAPPQDYSYAILANARLSKNLILGLSKEGSEISGDIGANHGGINEIILQNLSFSGGNSIVALDSGENRLAIKNIKTLDFAVMAAVGPTAENSLISYDFNPNGGVFQDGTGTLSGLMWAEDGGRNDLRVRLSDKSAAARVDLSTFDLSFNTLVVQNVEKAVSTIRYIGGETQILFAGSNTKENIAFEEVSTDRNKQNTRDYYDGIKLIIDAEDANAMLKDFRDYKGLEENKAVVSMINNSTFSFGGVYIGKIIFLDPDPATQAASDLNLVIKDLTIEKDSALAAIMSGGDAVNTINMHLNSGSRWVILPQTRTYYSVNSLTGSDEITFDAINQSGSTFSNPNTIIDIATGGVNTAELITKNITYSSDFYTHFVANNTAKLNNVVFRIYTNTMQKHTDFITIKGASEESNDARFQVYYSPDSLKNARAYNSGIGERMRIATVESAARNKFHFNTSEETLIKQGFVLVNTAFEKREEMGSSGLVDNYYIKSYYSYIDPKEANRSFSVLAANYLVFLANTNNINKRLGERRETQKADSFWIRSYGGQIVQNYGDKMINNYVSAQGGYDYGIRTDNAMHYIGIAFGYGINFLHSSSGKMDSSLYSGALYYSYVRDSGIYVDSILKYDYIDSNPWGFRDFSSHHISHAVSLTEELGYRLYMVDKKMYMDMGLEAIGGYLMGFETMQNRNMLQLLGQVPDFFAIRGRAYLNLAYRLTTDKTQTDFRIGGAYVGDYNTMRMRLQSLDYGDESRFSAPYNQMVVASIGVNSKLSEHFRIYLEGEMGFLGRSINQTWAANIGLQFAFGTTKKFDFAQHDEEDESVINVMTKTIDAPDTRCTGCNPESAIYLELFTLPEPSEALDRYLSARYDYRIHTQEGESTYYIGPFKSVKQAYSKQSEVNQAIQRIRKNAGFESTLVRIVNKNRT